MFIIKRYTKKDENDMQCVKPVVLKEKACVYVHRNQPEGAVSPRDAP